MENRGDSLNNPPVVLGSGKYTHMATLGHDPNTPFNLCIEAKSNTKTGELCMYHRSNSALLSFFTIEELKENLSISDATEHT